MKEKSVSKEPCNDCKEKVYRVYVNTTNLGTRQPMVEQAIKESLQGIGFNKMQAQAAAMSAIMMPTPNSLIYSGEKDESFEVLDSLLASGINASVTDSKQEALW